MLGLLIALSYAEGQTLPLSPEVAPFFFEPFTDSNWSKRWQTSRAARYTGQWTLRATTHPRNYREEKMLFASTQNAYYGLSTRFPTPFGLQNRTLVVQFETRFLKGMDCGGAYIKLFTQPDFNPHSLCNETAYHIMFGPDSCGRINRVHFIFTHPDNGVPVQRHLRNPPQIRNDKVNHLYTLIIRPDQSFELGIDGERVRNGTLLDDFDPPVCPPHTIDDPTDRKPDNWVDIDRIEDPNAVKPADWDDQPEFIPDPARGDPPADWLVDEPRFIRNPNAKRPRGWDSDLEGEWEAPLIPNPKCEGVSGCGAFIAPVIPNPKYVGRWYPPLIPNPEYRGPWRARQLPNPNYKWVDPTVYAKFPDIVGIGFELWMVNKDVGFGNVYLGDNETAVKQWNRVHFVPKHNKQDIAQMRREEAERVRDQAIIDKASRPKKDGKDQGDFEDEEAPTPAARPTRTATKTQTPRTASKTQSPRPAPTQESSAFFTNIRLAWLQMYNQNPQATMIVASGLALASILLLAFGALCRRTWAERRAKKKRQHAKDRAAERKRKAGQEKQEEVVQRSTDKKDQND
jgi:calnexin